MKLVSSPVFNTNFEITIKESVDTTGSVYAFYVRRKDGHYADAVAKQYRITKGDHTSYLNFFNQLAIDFDLCVPRNRKAGVKKPGTHSPQALLTRNLVPQIRYGYGDPAVTRVDDEHGSPIYYLLVTSNDAPDVFPILTSKDLVTWQFADFVFRPGNKPAWALEGEMISDYWAPELHKVADEYHVYFVARDKSTRELCIGVARGPAPAGPFIPDPNPTLKGNVIDPHIFTESPEEVYLLWKEDRNASWPGLLNNLLSDSPELLTTLFLRQQDQDTASFVATLWPWISTLEPMEQFLVQQPLIELVLDRYSEIFGELSTMRNDRAELRDKVDACLHYMKTPIFAQRLSPDGTLVGERIKIIENDLAWEAHLVEGMWLTKQNGMYYLLYTGNDFSTDQYGLGVAVSENLAGPYAKMPAQLLQSSCDWWAPGHPSLVAAPDGSFRMFYHAYIPGEAGYKKFRALLSCQLFFTKGGVIIR